MRVLVIIGMGIIALAAGLAFGQTLVAPPAAGRTPAAPAVADRIPAAPAVVGRLVVYVCPNHPEIQATWPARCPLCRTVMRPIQSPRVIRVHNNLGPAFDMDNSRWIDEDRARREQWRQERLGPYPNTTYPSGGYLYLRLPPGRRYPPGGYAYPGLPNAYNYYPGGRYYPYNNAPPGYYRNPATGQYHYVNPQRTYPGYGPYYRPNR